MTNEPDRPSESDLDGLRELVESAADAVPVRPKRQRRPKAAREQAQERKEDIQAYIIATRPPDSEPQPLPAPDTMEQAALDLVRSIERFIVRERRRAAWRTGAWMVIGAVWVVLIA
jgi:hypothetical protein